MRREIRAQIDAHLASERFELGGLLFGRVFHLPKPTTGGYSYFVSIEAAVASQQYQNSSVSLRMGTEVWDRAAEIMRNGLMVAGWYHSHPNLGVFFSSVDRATQGAFFNQPYALGLVIDPIRNEEMIFYGGASEQLPADAFAEIP
jgi:proteasome lid subunit RPN8/RPN11